jgi:phosphopantetheinyl transferase
MTARRNEGSTIRFIDDLAGWDGTVPATLLTDAATRDERRAALRALAAGALSLSPDLIEIEHPPDRPPRLGRPLGAGLYLSSAARGRFAALAVAPGPVGVDVEVLDLAAAIPWNVLHPVEAKALAALAARPRALAFTRLWSLKESYLKALGVGFGREPGSFTVHLSSEGASVEDRHSRARVAEAATAWRVGAGAWVAVSTVVLSAPP